jgi:cellulose synthase/poly-beta-1,6-N-acetylglucosamine synthase-like glycosyltransferase
MIETIFFVLYAADILLLGMYGLNLFYMILQSRRGISRCVSGDDELPRYPYVTVQLPLYNERYVAERALRGAAAIDYPRDRFEIQVLDDSTDETREITRRAAAELRELGYTVNVIRRRDRTGGKGGALREGLERGRGEFIAVFDADFVPAPEILSKALPELLGNPRVGVVQTRWGHLNTEHSGLTKAQALAMDGHFAVEQVGRRTAGLFMNFNGTAGVWRRKCILDAGNWQDDTLTEDLDLSYRAELKGWTIAYLNDVVNPSELPVQINAYKAQQFRWAKGSIQTGLKLLGTLFRSSLPAKIKLQGFLHLSYYSVHPLLVFNILLSLPLIFGLYRFGGIHQNALRIFASLFTVITFAPILFCIYSQRALYDDWPRRLPWIPYMLLLGTGVALNNTRAFLEAVFGKRSEFVRTPKFGTGSGRNFWKGRDYRTRFSSLSPAELLMVLYLSVAVIYAVRVGAWVLLPYLLYYLAAFGYVFAVSVVHGFARSPVAETGSSPVPTSPPAHRAFSSHDE